MGIAVRPVAMLPVAKVYKIMTCTFCNDEALYRFFA